MYCSPIKPDVKIWALEGTEIVAMASIDSSTTGDSFRYQAEYSELGQQPRHPPYRRANFQATNVVKGRF